MTFPAFPPSLCPACGGHVDRCGCNRFLANKLRDENWELLRELANQNRAVDALLSENTYLRARNHPEGETQ